MRTSIITAVLLVLTTPMPAHAGERVRLKEVPTLMTGQWCWSQMHNFTRCDSGDINIGKHDYGTDNECKFTRIEEVSTNTYFIKAVCKAEGRVAKTRVKAYINERLNYNSLQWHEKEFGVTESRLAEKKWFLIYDVWGSHTRGYDTTPSKNNVWPQTFRTHRECNNALHAIDLGDINDWQAWGAGAYKFSGRCSTTFPNIWKD